ncbi:hypothetical protein GQ457_15G018060 [Hibiscus cannabinus]
MYQRPWQYDKRVIHNCYTNQYSFTHEGKKVILAPLTPSKVHEDQIRLKASIAAWKASKEKNECEQEEVNLEVIYDSIFSSTSSKLHVNKVMSYEVLKIANASMSSAFIFFSEIQQPSLPQIDIPFHSTIDFSSLDYDFFGCTLDCVPCVEVLVDC